MTVSASFRDFIIEQMGNFGPVTVRNMFGGAGVYRDGVMFALLNDEAVYLKTDAATKPAFEKEDLPPFTYGKDGMKMEISYYRVPERCLDDREEMATWCRNAYDVALKAAVRKKPKKHP